MNSLAQSTHVHAVLTVSKPIGLQVCISATKYIGRRWCGGECVWEGGGFQQPEPSDEITHLSPVA